MNEWGKRGAAGSIASRAGVFRRVFFALAVLVAAVVCRGQGSLTITFSGQAAGTQFPVGTYSESGVSFTPIAPGQLWLIGSGISGYPDNGTSYLGIPDGSLGGVRINFSPTTLFDLVSFDGARFATAAPQTLTVVGYKPQIMGPTLMVTNYFTFGNGGEFQTFFPDSSFANLSRVDVLNATWSLDNLVLGGVPEPSTGALVVLAGAAFGVWRKARRKSAIQ